MEFILPVEAPPTFGIREACEAAVRLALRTGTVVRFNWNGVTILARGEHNAATLAEQATRVLEHGGKLVI